MSAPLCHRLLKTVACVCYFLPTLLLSQVIIREKVEIKPQPLPRSVQGALPIRVESSFDGGVDPNLPQLIWLNGPCAVDVASGNISGTLTAPAYDGAYKAGYRFTNPAGGTGGQFRFAVYLGDSLVREFRTPVSCPTGCTLFSEWDIRVYAGFTFSPQSAVIGSGGTNTFGAVESTSTVPCSPGVWMSEWPIELEITKGQDVGSFVDGGKRSYTVAKKKSEFSTFGFLADGQKGYGDVEITARSGGITVVKGFKVVAPAPRVHIVPPWWWYGQPIKLSFDNLPVLEFGETHTPRPGQKFEPVITWEPDDTINTADYFNQVNELYVKVKAENAGGVARDSVKLVFQTECIKVNFDPSELSPGDTARLSFQRVKEDGTLEDLPAGSYTFSVMIVGGEDSSRGLFITEEEEPEGGTTLLYASAPILYIAPASIPDTSMKVQVIGAAWEVIWGKKDEVKGQAPGIRQLSVKEAEGKRGREQEGKAKGDLAKPVTVARLAALLASWCPINEVVVKRVPTDIELELSSEQIQHSDQVTLMVAFLYEQVKMNSITDDTKISFSLGSEGETFGTLRNTATNSQGSTLLDVPFSQVRNGSIVFTADGQEYDGRFPLGINIGAATVVNDKLLVDVQATYLSGPNTRGILYLQGDSRWEDSTYDNSSLTLGDLGCALSCMAMVLKAYGVNVNPETLNAWMRENTGFDGTVVKWTTIGRYKNSPVKHDEPIGDGLQRNPVTGKRNIPPAILPSLSELDAALGEGRPIIAQVLNPDTNNNHWVVVTGRTPAGDYTILDPNGTPRVTLGGVYKTIYKYVPITSK